MGDALCDLVKDRLSETELGPEDSVSQVASCQGAMSTTSGKLLARQINLDRRRAERRAIYASDLARTKAKSDAAAVAAAAPNRLCTHSTLTTSDLRDAVL